MGQRIIYGVPTMTLQEVVREYMIQQGNHRRNHEVEYMVNSYRVWLDLFRTTIWTMQYKVLEVDKTTNTIVLPCNMERVFGISIVDECGRMRPIGYNPNMNTLQVRCHNKTCSCTTCNGEDTLCDAIDSISYRTEDVVLEGETYQKKIWNKKSGCNLVEVMEVPAVDGDTVSYITQERVVCALDVDTNGCIKPTLANRELIETHCGCYISSCQQKVCFQEKNPDGPALPANFNDYGHYKPDAICDNIWHLKDVKGDKVILSYQVSGESDVNGQINVPLYAIQAVKLGMRYYGMLFKNNTPLSQKREAERDWNMARRELFLYMNPININEFMRLPTRVVKW